VQVYLDSSAIVKRYIEEVGTEVVDIIFDAAESGDIKIFFSIWNFGEILGVFDKYMCKNWITESDFKNAVEKFARESIKLAKLHQLEIIPLNAKIVADSMEIILRYHIYEADAIQIISSKYGNCELFLTADKQLVKIARDFKLNAFNVEREQKEIRNLIKV